MAEKTFILYTQQQNNKPFFLYLIYTAPHVSLQAPDEAFKEYVENLKRSPITARTEALPTLHLALLMRL